MGIYDNCCSLSGSLSLQVIETVENFDYNKLKNIPSINGVLLQGDLKTQDLGIERGYDVHVDPQDEEHIILTT